MIAELRFGRFTLNGRRRELRYEGSRIALDPVGLRILFYLAEHRSRAVSRSELWQAVWPDVHVGPSSLSSASCKEDVSCGDPGTGRSPFC